MSLSFQASQDMKTNLNYEVVVVQLVFTFTILTADTI